MSITDEVLRKVSPSEEDTKRIEKCAKDTLEEIRKDDLIKENDIEVMLVGSVAKGTYLKNPDIDIFLRFPESTGRKEMQTIGLRIGKKHLENYEERYAEHPYAHGMKCGYEMDIVPCYRLDSAQSIRCAVDRTPFHTRYILTNMDTYMKDEARVLKQFAKGTGVYGAESRIEGMSGYLLELLILKYGSFEKTLKEASSEWHYGCVLFPNNVRKFKEDALVVHDPVDPDRNVASALSVESLAMFIHAAREYLKRPSQNFFFPLPKKIHDVAYANEYFIKRNTNAIIVELDRPDLIDDNLYPQVRKTIDGLSAILKKESVVIFDSAYHLTDDKVQLVLEVEDLKMPSIILHQGPPVWSANSESFLSKWDKNSFAPYIENGIWNVIILREDRDVGKYIEKNLKNAALGKAFRSLSGLEVHTTDVICEKYMAVISAMIDKRMNWETV